MTQFQPEVAPTRYAGNPTIPLGAGGSYFEEQIFDFAVLVDPADSTKLIMYATGMAAPALSGNMSIGRFTASVAAPYTWTSRGQILAGAGGSTFDSVHARNGSVVYNAGTYYLYYTGYQADEGVGSIGLATSSDGITWTRSGSNPVLTPTGQGRNDGTSVSEPAVLWEGGTTWTMIYAYRNGTTILPGYRVATSSDGIAWTKVGSGDVVSSEKQADNGSQYCEFHQLTKIDGVYYIFYEMGGTAAPFRIYAATAAVVTGPYSTLKSGPVLKESGSVGAFDRYHVATPFVMQIGESWRLFYCGAGLHDQPYGTNTWPGGMADFSTRALNGGRQ